jgi:hypothetical protein
MDPIVSIDKSKKVPVYTVKKILTNEETNAFKGKFIENKHYPVVLKEDADVYTEEGELLLRFRKDVLSKKAIDDAYEAMKDFMKRTTTDRGIASGSDRGLTTGHQTAVRSNILGYFDKWSISQRATFKQSGIKFPGTCRLTTFNVKYPEKWKQVVPLIKEIDAQYKLLCPEEHTSQRQAAKKTPFHIHGTAFSTITTNFNFRTAAHQDSGDWPEGFGNLVVIERGTPYEGCYTGFPQYGVAVDCRTGDFLAMDVHQLHGNTPKTPASDDRIRLSLVSYLREQIVKKCKGQPMYDAQRLEKKLQAFRDRKSQKNKGLRQRQQQRQQRQGLKNHVTRKQKKIKKEKK